MSEVRAGGTDLGERRRSGVSHGPVLDLGRRQDLSTVEWNGSDGGATIGALVTIADLAADTRIGAAYPGLAAAADGLATPQIRRVATVGGNLLQRNRCWYFRHPATSCLKKGGTNCPARSGNHRYGVLFDLGPCVAPHPSTLGAALLAYEATVETDRRTALPIAELFGDGTVGTHDHQLEADELLTRVTLPPPVTSERAAYVRTTSRAYAEWPLAEAVVRLSIEYAEGGGNGTVAWAAVAVGGVAPVPLRMPRVEAALIGQPVTTTAFAAAAAYAIEDANPLPMTGYKTALLVGTITDVLERATNLTEVAVTGDAGQMTSGPP
jgi:xanthine dehydrogenase YagS FAD-binding subunit